MDELLKFIQEHLPFLISHRYLFLFLGGLIEGMNSLIFGGFLASFGQVKTALILPLLIFAHTLNGYMWYTVGYFGGSKSLDKWGHKSKLSHNIINTINNYFQKYSSRAIMFSKFTFSLEIATLIMAGSLKYNLRKFSKYNFYGSVGWVLMTFFVGYFFGQSFKLFFTFIKNLTLAFAFLGGAVALIYLITILLRRYYVGYLLLRERLKNLREKVVDGIDSFLSGGEEN